MSCEAAINLQVELMIIRNMAEDTHVLLDQEVKVHFKANISI